TRADAFAEDWATIEVYVKDPKVQAKTVWAYLKRLRPGKYQEGQLRALQRRIKQWRALYGAGKEVYFPQEHHPGDLCTSDFVHMGDLGITVGRIPYDHLLYHFVLTYSNWETGSLCQSESFESLSAGLQNALWELGGAAARHRTDWLTAAVRALGRPAEEFTRRYQGLLAHYRMRSEAIQAGKANENGDVEQRHYRFKQAVEQALLMRGSRDFADMDAYRSFLRTVTDELNAGRKTRFEEERARLSPLPKRRLEDWTRMQALVSTAGTIQVQNNTYSVHSRLIGEKVEVRLHMEELEIWYAGKCVDRMARLRGRQGHRIQIS
ncbi:MAG: IS21 family transposase, partial [Planctomycetota bacterium]